MISSPVSSASPASYPRRDDGSVNWRAMVKPEHLYVKREHEDKVAKLLSKPVAELDTLTAEDVAKIPDRYLVIRKAGILELARLRGYLSATPQVKHVQRDYVVVQTWIEWAPFESEPSKRTGGVGEAHPENTSRLGAAYLASNAENRAFSRAVRQFLEIDIVSSDELGSGVEPEQNQSRMDSSSPTSGAGIDLSPAGSLSRIAMEAGFSFDQVKKAAIARWDEDTAILLKTPTAKRRIENDPNPWGQWSDVPPHDCLTLIQLIKAFQASRQAAAAQKAAESKDTAVPQSAAQPAASEPASDKPKATRKPRAPRVPKTDTPSSDDNVTPITGTDSFVAEPPAEAAAA